MTSLAPRVVLVTRPSEFTLLLARHATRGQAAFQLSQRAQSITRVEAQHQTQDAALAQARAAIPPGWTMAEVSRDDLDRFLFTANDIVVAIGQDGLVANLAKYLTGQPVIGITPDPATSEAVLTRHAVTALPGLLAALDRNAARTEARTMIEAKLANGPSLRALNEIFVGHRSHQSARYLLRQNGQEEFQSSSGLIVASGTGITGWARSILTATGKTTALTPAEARGVYLVREAWPSRTSGTTLSHGEVTAAEPLDVVSRMNAGGVIFADGIEQDFLTFDYGVTARISPSAARLTLVSDLL